MLIGMSRSPRDEGDDKRIFQLARACGFAGLQLKPGQYRPFGTDARRFKAAYGDLADLARGGIVVYPGAAYRNWVETVQDDLAFAKEIGGELICLSAGVRREHVDTGGIKGVADVLNALGRQAGQLGVAVSLHNHADTIFAGVEDLERLFEHVDPAACGLTFDTAHAALGGIEHMPKALVRFRDYLNNVHLKDLSSDGRFCPIGSGTLDLRAIVGQLAEMDYPNWLIVDEESDEYTVQEVFEQSVRFLQESGLLPSR